MLTLRQAADQIGVTWQAIYSAIRLKKFKYNRIGGKYFVTQSYIDDYMDHRWDRSRSLINGRPIFDIEKGTYDIACASEIFCVTKQSLYHAIRTKKLACRRIRKMYILDEDDIISYLKNHKKRIA